MLETFGDKYRECMRQVPMFIPKRNSVWIQEVYMDPQAVNIASGITLLVVFALVGWYVRHRRSARGSSAGSRRKIKKLSLSIT